MNAVELSELNQMIERVRRNRSEFSLLWKALASDGKVATAMDMIHRGYPEGALEHLAWQTFIRLTEHKRN